MGLGDIGGAVSGGVVGGAVVRLVLDQSQFTSGLSSSQGRLQTWGRRMSTVGSGLTRGLTLPIAAVGIAAIKLASDAEETENKVRVVFEDMADEVVQWSGTSIDKMGLARQSAQDMATQFGLLFQAAKLPGPEVVGMSQDFTQLAADMASFFNIPIDEALMTLRSGLVGETEPLRRFGVLLSEAAVQEEALRSGLAKTTEEITEQDKVTARAAIIMQSLSKTHGDFARTSGSTANQTRSLVERLKEMGAELGRELLPIAKDVLGAVQGLLGGFRSLSPETRSLVVKIALLAAALGPVLRITGSLLSLSGKLINFFSLLGGASIPAAGGVTTLAGSFAKLRAALVVGGPIGILVAAAVHATSELPKQQAEFRDETESLTEALRTGNLELAEAEELLKMFALGGDAAAAAHDYLAEKFGIVIAGVPKLEQAIEGYGKEVARTRIEQARFTDRLDAMSNAHARAAGFTADHTKTLTGLREAMADIPGSVRSKVNVEGTKAATIDSSKLLTSLREIDGMVASATVQITSKMLMTGPREGGPRPAQHGFHGFVRNPTLFLAGEAGPERVDITPEGGGQAGAGRGSSPVMINIRVNTVVKAETEAGASPAEIARAIQSEVSQSLDGHLFQAALRKARIR